MTYAEFLGACRALMASVVKAGFERLSDPTYEPVIAAAGPEVDDVVVDRTTLDLFAAGLLNAGDLRTAADSGIDVIAEITEEGLIAIGEQTFDNPRRAVRAMTDAPVARWDFWVLASTEEPPTLRELLEQIEATVD